ncbi:MAG TPA: CHAT domain-containing protein [Vicinamibacterales bacterium]|nr:CHAT domain-containing protein [Vicinamibacterales bacterium]
MPDPHVKQLGECPDSRLIAAYVDGRLSESERDTLHRHLAACDNCTELVAEIVAANDAAVVPAPPESSDQPAAPSPVLFFRRHRLAVASTLLAAAAALALVVRVMLPQSAGEISSRDARRADPNVVSLTAALGGTRPIEGRLTGGFTYGEVRTPDRSLAPPDNLALVAAAGEIQKRADANPSAANLHAWGIAQLLVGRYDGSVETLESVLMQQRQDPRVAADLGTARLARAGALDAPEDLPRALEAIEQALTLDPNLAEAWFTKAIVLERLQIRHQAREAWTTYLQLDPDSGWSAEARRRLAALEPSSSMRPWSEIERALRDPAVDAGVIREAVSRDPMEVRELVVREILAQWAAAEPVGEPERRSPSDQAGAQLDLAGRIAGILEQSGPDHSLDAAITDIRKADTARRTMIAAGIRELAGGFAAQSAERPVAEIRPHFEAAARLLRTGRSSLDVWAAFALARLAVVQQRHDEVVSYATAAIERAKRIGAAAVAARAHWLLGMTAFTLNNWSAAMRHYEEALRLCEATAETTLAASVHLNASVLNRFLGNVGATWRHRLIAGAGLPAYRPVQRHTYLTSGAVTASTESLPLTALVFQNEVVSNAASLSAGQRAEAALTRARMLARLGRTADAERDLEQAEQLLAAVQSDALRARFSRAALLASAEVRTRSDPARAAGDAGHAVALIAKSGEPMRLAEASLLESRALAKLGRIDEARVAAERGIDAFERALASIDPRDPIRISALDPAWALYSDAARLHLVRGREGYAAAFALLERGRARTLIDLRRVTPLSLADVQERLKSDEALLLLDQSSSSLVTWWITSASVRTASANASVDQVEALVSSHRQSVDRGERKNPASAALFDLAIRSWWPDLRNTATVAVIPDGAWSRVAWPALWETSSGVELVSGAGFVIAPSASVAASGRWNKDALVRTAIVVSAADTGTAAVLPAARREAKEISGMYPEGRLLQGGAATPANVLRELDAADIVHVASHSVDVPGYPALSHLVLTGSQADGRLLVRDIAARHLSQTRLVVLAACATAGRRAVRGEGTVGIAWGFLTAGTRHVIATLQDIEDAPAGALFTSVHRGIAAGRTPSEALHDTQRRLAASGASPRVWATVAIFGAL